jgi:hypothetical protein
MGDAQNCPETAQRIGAETDLGPDFIGTLVPNFRNAQMIISSQRSHSDLTADAHRAMRPQRPHRDTRCHQFGAIAG